jgi:hypothetical protein
MVINRRIEGDTELVWLKTFGLLYLKVDINFAAGIGLGWDAIMRRALLYLYSILI